MVPRYRDIDAEIDWAADQDALAAELARDAHEAHEPAVSEAAVGGPPVFSTDPF